MVQPTNKENKGNVYAQLSEIFFTCYTFCFILLLLCFRWCLIVLCGLIWLMRLVISVYHLYYAYDTKLFYNNALKIKEVGLNIKFVDYEQNSSLNVSK